MSHLHVPDGVLPLWLIVLGWVLTFAGVALAVRVVSRDDRRRGIPLVGAVAALMLVGMSTEIVPIAYHINLTVAAGILLGPWLSIPVALIVVAMLALVGHGGVTVIGLNAVVIAFEMIVGGVLFSALRRMFAAEKRAGLAAGIATVVTLALSTALVVGIVALGGPLAAERESGAFDPETLRFENPFAHGLIGSHLLGGEEDDHDHDHADEGTSGVRIERFALLAFGLGSIGWIIEALITGAIIGFIARVRPSLMFRGALRPYRMPPGDEGIGH